jgi:hypothetical protein
MPDIDRDILEAKRKACSLEGYRFIAEQLAALAGKPVMRMDIEVIIAQAQFALQSERELKLDALRENADNGSPVHNKRTTDNEAMDLP